MGGTEFDLAGTEPLPGVPMVDVLDETGRVVHVGYYVRHVNRTPCPLGDRVGPRDVEHLVVVDDFSDWNMPRGIRVLRVTPPHTIRLHGQRTDGGE